MSEMKRQHLISLIFLAAMGLWIGGGMAVCGFTGLGGSYPPSVVYEQAAPVGEFNPDEYHEDRYLDWGASSGLRASTAPRGEAKYTLISVEKGPSFTQVPGGPAC